MPTLYITLASNNPPRNVTEKAVKLTGVKIGPGFCIDEDRFIGPYRGLVAIWAVKASGHVL